jgi:NADH dehydrogenase (ubiquinone) 1 alpha subcomplex subunit 6
MRATSRLLVTIPSRLAQPARVSASQEEARARALALYRKYYRAGPEIVALFALNIPPSTLRAKFRELFERNRHVRDLSVIDVLLHKGQVDFQETINAWKPTSQLMKLFIEEEVSGTMADIRIFLSA